MPNVRFGPEQNDAYEVWRDQLVDDFEKWLSRLPLRVDPGDLGMLLDWKRDHGNGRLDRWTRSDEESFLLGWCPRHLSASAEEAHGLPSTVALTMSFLATRGLVAAGSEPIERLTEHAVGLQSEFMTAMADPSNFGLAKSIFGRLDLDPDELGDPSTLQHAIERFNALPEEERRRITDPAMRVRDRENPYDGDDLFDPDLFDPDGLVDAGDLFDPGDLFDADDFMDAEGGAIGTAVRPSAESVRASAESAPVLTGFARLADYFAPPGKVLTKAGNIKLADARVLVDLLGTGESFERTHGDLEWRTRSATRLPELDHWQWWARKAGAIRKKGDRLVAVKAWRQRRQADPVGEVRRALDALLDHGVVQSFRTWFHGYVDQLVDACALPILVRLLRDVTQDFGDLIEVLGELFSEVDIEEHYPGDLADTVERLVIMLERTGVIEHRRYAAVENRYGRHHRSGGALSLTPVGVAIAIDLAAESGLPLEVIEDPATSTVTAIVGRVESSGPAEWWDLAGAWLDTQPEPTDAVESLIDELGVAGAHWQLLLLGAAPESRWPLLESALRRRAFDEHAASEASSVALHCLLAHAALDPSEVDRERLLEATLVSMGILAEASPEQVADSMAEDLHAAGAYEVIDAALRRMPPRAEILLDAIGAHHPDKSVAKAARRALFRLRSRLAGPGERSRS